MAWKPNLPDKLARGVTVSARKGAGGRPYVMIALWADVLAETGWAKGAKIDVLEGTGEDAGKIRLEAIGPREVRHGGVRELKSTGTKGAGNCLQLPVHWPSYEAPFAAVAAAHAFDDGALVITMPAPEPLFLEREPVLEVASARLTKEQSDELLRAAKAPCTEIQFLQPAVKPKTVADLAPAPVKPQSPGVSGTAKPLVVNADVSRLRTIANGLAGVSHRYLMAFLDKGALTWAELVALHDQEVSSNTVRMKLGFLRGEIAGTGWTLAEKGMKVELVFAPPESPPPPPPPPPAAPAALKPEAPAPESVPEGSPPWLAPALARCTSAKARVILPMLATEGQVSMSAVIYAFSPPIKETYAQNVLSDVRRALAPDGWALDLDPAAGVYRPVRKPKALRA